MRRRHRIPNSHCRPNSGCLPLPAWPVSIAMQLLRSAVGRTVRRALDRGGMVWQWHMDGDLEGGREDCHSLRCHVHRAARCHHRHRLLSCRRRRRDGQREKEPRAAEARPAAAGWLAGGTPISSPPPPLAALSSSVRPSVRPPVFLVPSCSSTE